MHTAVHHDDVEKTILMDRDQRLMDSLDQMRMQMSAFRDDMQSFKGDLEETRVGLMSVQTNQSALKETDNETETLKREWKDYEKKMVPKNLFTNSHGVKSRSQFLQSKYYPTKDLEFYDRPRDTIEHVKNPEEDNVSKLPDFRTRYSKNNVARVSVPFDMESKYSDTSSEYLDRGISDLSRAERSGAQHRKPQKVVEFKRAESYRQLADVWRKSMIKSDGHNLIIWRANGLAYFRSVGIVSFNFINPHDTPKTLDAWDELDTETYRSPWYHQYRDEVKDSGEILTLDFSWKDDLVKLNAVYLALVETWPGLRTSIDSTVESTVDRHSMSKVLPSSLQMNHVGYGRYIFFNVFKKFIDNTETSRLAKSRYIQSGMSIAPGQSIEDFANTLTMEVNTLNMLSKEEIFGETHKITILKDVVTKTFSGDRFWTKLALLKARVAPENRSFTFDELVEDWHTLEKEIEDENKGGGDSASGSVYSTTITKNSGKNHYTPHLSSSSSSSSSSTLTSPHSSSSSAVLNVSAQRSKHASQNTSLKRDAKGKLVCFNYARDGNCSFGSSCKYSHDRAAAAAVLNAFTVEEVNNIARTQFGNVVQQKAAAKWRGKFKKYRNTKQRRYQKAYAAGYSIAKERYSAKSGGSSSSKSSASPTDSTFQSTIRRQQQKAKKASANLTESKANDYHSDLDSDMETAILEIDDFSDSDLSDDLVSDSDE